MRVRQGALPANIAGRAHPHTHSYLRYAPTPPTPPGFMSAGATAGTMRARGTTAASSPPSSDWMLHECVGGRRVEVAGARQRYEGARRWQGRRPPQPAARSPQHEVHLDVERGGAQQQPRPGPLVPQARQRRDQAAQRVPAGRAPHGSRGLAGLGCARQAASRRLEA